MTEMHRELAPVLRGDLVLPQDPGYDRARAVYNAMIDKRPAAVVRCRDVADVIACVLFGREHGVDIAVRGGGHNAGGLGVWDDALVIDLSLMRSTTVSPEERTVRVDGGCLWGDVDHATSPFGMATPSGIVASTGVAGLTLGGGIGNLARRFGLSVDNLLSADVVLADGSFVTASPSSHDDLFWALRGGGGNFGVVTSFTFRCHDIGDHGTVIGGPVFYDFADTADIMSWYRDLLPTLPETLSGWIGLASIPPAPPIPEALWGRKSCFILWSYTGPHDEAGTVLEATSHGTPLFSGVQPIPFPTLQSMFDPLFPPGLQWYWKADFFEEISDTAIDIHLKYGERLPTPLSTMHLYPIDGAVSRVPADATAFAYRDGGWAGVIVGIDPDPANAPLITQWTRSYWHELHDTSAGGAYVNFLMDDEGQDRVRASYRGNYELLSHIKSRYDPTNVFHINQNIRPTILV